MGEAKARVLVPKKKSWLRWTIIEPSLILDYVWLSWMPTPKQFEVHQAFINHGLFMLCLYFMGYPWHMSIHWPCQFRSMMCASMDGQSIAKFWGRLKTLRCYSEHRLLHDLTDAELCKTVPFAIHGDGAEFHRHSEYFVMSWTSAFQCGSGGNCLVSRYPVSLVAEAHMTDDSELWRWIIFRNTANQLVNSGYGSEESFKLQLQYVYVAVGGGGCVGVLEVVCVVAVEDVINNGAEQLWLVASLFCGGSGVVAVAVVAAFVWWLGCMMCYRWLYPWGTSKCQRDIGEDCCLESSLRSCRRVPAAWLLWWSLWPQIVPGWPPWEAHCQWLQATWESKS